MAASIRLEEFLASSCARSRVTCKFSHVAVGQGRGEYAVDKKGDSVDGRAIFAGRSAPVTGRM